MVRPRNRVRRGQARVVRTRQKSAKPVVASAKPTGYIPSGWQRAGLVTAKVAIRPELPRSSHENSSSSSVHLGSAALIRNGPARSEKFRLTLRD